MTIAEEVVAFDDVLLRAATADARAWAEKDATRANEWLIMRNRAVRAAVDAGHGREHIADVLGVRAADVDYMLRSSAATAR